MDNKDENKPVECVETFTKCSMSVGTPTEKKAKVIDFGDSKLAGTRPSDFCEKRVPTEDDAIGMAYVQAFARKYELTPELQEGLAKLLKEEVILRPVDVPGAILSAMDLIRDKETNRIDSMYQHGPSPADFGDHDPIPEDALYRIEMAEQ